MKPTKNLVEKAESCLSYLVEDALGVALGSDVFAGCESPRKAIHVGNTPNPKFGDISVACFGLAKEYYHKVNINQAEVTAVANMLVSAISSDSAIESISVAGPYVNIRL